MKVTSEVDRLEEKIKELEGKVSSLEAGNKILRDDFKEPEAAEWYVTIGKLEKYSDVRLDPVVTLGGKCLKTLLDAFIKCSSSGLTYKHFSLEYDDIEVKYSDINSIYSHVCLEIVNPSLKVETKYEGTFYFDSDSESFLSRERCEFNADSFLNDFYPLVSWASSLYLDWEIIVENYLDSWYEEDLTEKNVADIAMKLSMERRRPYIDNSKYLYPTVVEVLENNR